MKVLCILFICSIYMLADVIVSWIEKPSKKKYFPISKRND